MAALLTHACFRLRAIFAIQRVYFMLQAIWHHDKSQEMLGSIAEQEYTSMTPSGIGRSADHLIDRLRKTGCARLCNCQSSEGHSRPGSRNKIPFHASAVNTYIRLKLPERWQSRPIKSWTLMLCAAWQRLEMHRTDRSTGLLLKLPWSRAAPLRGRPSQNSR